MPTVGETLRAAREKKGVTPAEVAAATHIKVQHIQAMERDDFSRIAAAAYAKGFIRLYAEFLELDSVPLIAEYVARHAPPPPATILPDPAASAPAKESKAGKAPRTPWKDRLGRFPWQRLALAGGSLVLALFLISAISRLVRLAIPDGSRLTTNRERTPDLAIVREPPPPYMEAAGPEAAPK